MTKNLNVPPNKQIFITPPPVDETAWIKYSKIKYGLNLTESNRTNNSASEYAARVEIVSNQLGARFLNLHQMMMNSTEWEKYLSDGLHLSSEGSNFLFEQLFKLHVDELTEDDKLFLPEWRDLAAME